jgi:DNA recombination protein RmuC
VINLFWLLVVAAIAAVAAYQLSEARRWRQQARENLQENQRLREEAEEARATAREKEAVAAVQLKLITESKEQVEERFRSLAQDALHSNSQLFLDRSREQMRFMIEPVNQSLQRFEAQVQEMEKARAGAYQGIVSQVQSLTELQERVRQSTEQLKTALRSPIQRGRWGEMQLRRVVELAGMLEYCDIAEQKTLFGETNLRPDLTVRLPNQCQVIVDAKVSLEAYLRATEAESEAERARHLADHARQVRNHVKSLGEKAYWERLPCSPEFVVAFLPLESLFSAALETDPTLLDFGVERRVLIATPLTLISLLLTVAHGWRQQGLAENVERIREAGTELYSRMSTMYGHFTKLGEAIEKTVSTYNATVGSLERSVLPSARRLREMRPTQEEALSEIEELESSARKLDGGKWRTLEAAE